MSLLPATNRPSETRRESLRDVPVVRAFIRLGLPFYRVVTALYIVLHVARIVLFDGTALVNPLNHGIDTWTYYAAGQRLNDGHPLYSLTPGDLDVPLAPPYVTVPLLSPPSIAVAWRPLSHAHAPELVNAAWLLICAAVFLGTVLWMVRRATAVQLVALAVLAPALALTTVSGNINALLAPLLVLAWGWAAEGRHASAGAAVAVAGVLKITPAFMLVWFLAQRSCRGVAGFAATMALLAVISLLGAGVQSHIDYLDVIRYTSSEGFSGWSIPAYLLRIGLDADSTAVFVATAAIGSVVVVGLRHRPSLSWSAAVVTMVLMSPVVHLVAASFLLAAVASLGPEPSCFNTASRGEGRLNDASA